MTDATDCRRCAQSRLYVLAVLLVVVALAPATRAPAPEYIVDEQPAPASVEDERAPMEEVYPVEPRLPSVFPRLKKRLETAAPLWRDTQLRLHPRVYYFDRDRENANDWLQCVDPGCATIIGRYTSPTYAGLRQNA